MMSEILCWPHSLDVNTCSRMKTDPHLFISSFNWNVLVSYLLVANLTIASRNTVYVYSRYTLKNTRSVTYPMSAPPQTKEQTAPGILLSSKTLATILEPKTQKIQLSNGCIQ